VRTGRPYDDHVVSVITVKNREVTHWRDYMDPVAVFRAIGWPARDQQKTAAAEEAARD
jgi:ketosteroid isomerase-like protein